MIVLTPAQFYVVWAASFFAALLALLKWTHRRTLTHRRIAKGLRSYTAGAQVLS
jgi:hypothetical protein